MPNLHLTLNPSVRHGSCLDPNHPGKATLRLKGLRVINLLSLMTSKLSVVASSDWPNEAKGLNENPTLTLHNLPQTTLIPTTAIFPGTILGQAVKGVGECPTRRSSGREVSRTDASCEAAHDAAIDSSHRVRPCHSHSHVKVWSGHVLIYIPSAKLPSSTLNFSSYIHCQRYTLVPLPSIDLILVLISCVYF